MADLETLEAVGVLGLLAAGIKDLVDHFCALGVVSLGPVITGAGILVDEVVRPEKFTERTCTNRIDNSGFKVKKHRTRHILAARRLMVEDVNAVELGVVVAIIFLIFEQSKKEKAKIVDKILGVKIFIQIYSSKKKKYIYIPAVFAITADSMLVADYFPELIEGR